MLAAYGSIERIPDDDALWTAKPRGAQKLAATLAAHRDDALLFKRLATLRTDAPVHESLSDSAWRGAKPELRRIASELGFGDELLERVPRWAP